MSLYLGHLIFRSRQWCRVVLFGLMFLVAAPSAATMLEVKIEGVEGALLTNVEAFLRIWQERTNTDLLPARIRRLHSRAPDQIRKALAPFGYYRVEVAADLAAPGEGREAWSATYRISRGEPATVAGVDFGLEGEAREDPGFPQVFALREGDVLVHSRWEAAKRSLLLAAAERGYLDARILDSRVVVDPESNTARATIRFDSGSRYFFGPVKFRQEGFDPEFLQRFVGLTRGEPYDQNQVLQLQGRLLDTEYFRRVEMVPMTAEADPATREVPIEVELDPNLRDKYRIGAGYSTDVGFKLMLDWRRRWVNRRGHNVRAELIVAQRLQELSGEYRIPLQRPATDYFFIRPRAYRLQTESRAEQTVSLDAAFSVLRDGWRRNIGVQFRYEDDDISDDQEEVNEIVPFIELSRTVTDDPLFTSRGYRAKGFLLGTADYVGSTSSYISTGINGKLIRSFADGDYRFLARADLGATLAGSIDDVPGSRRFFAGGDQSIRGFGFERLGPVDKETGDVVGGRYLGVGSIELERRIVDKWSGAVFYDFGNAYDPDYANAFAQSVGAGVRWRSPLGQIRVDLGYGFEPFDNLRLHLVIGPDL